jgi:LETM1 and EF-hand domain-containing protein 1
VWPARNHIGSLSLMDAVSLINAQHMAAASISSTLRSRSFHGLTPSIPLSPLQGRLQLRFITTESQRTSPSAPPPIPSSAATPIGTKVATNPPLQATPPSPPLPVSSIPPKIVDVAAEKAQEKLVKKEEKPKKGLPARAWAKVKEEASHYWHGTKLLGQEIKISAKLQYKVLQGSTLTRRERRQVG